MTSDLTLEKAALNRAAKVLGGQAALASALGFSDRRNVSPYFTTARRLPAEHCPTIERATREAGEVVSCEELRPDVAWDVLRMQTADTRKVNLGPAARRPSKQA
jgi:DNA-binding transcriptional regulator YdaS (Cro superfamily)